MNRLGTALLAAVEAIVTVGVGVGIALVPLTLLWGFEYGLQIDWDVFWKAAGSVWLVGHGVDVTFRLGSDVAGASGVEGAADPIHVTLAALGFAVVTAWLGGRAGRRFAETEHRATGLLVGTAAVALLGLAVALSSTSAATDPVVWQAVVLPALWFAVPALVTSEVCRVRRGLPADPLTRRVLDQVDRIPALWRTVAGFAFRAGTAVTAVVVAAAGVVVAFLLVTSFAEVIALYERSHAGVIGGIALTVGQLAFLPDFVGWAVAWLVGPGFAIGTGSSVSPVGTSLGPIPGVPVFGALPASGHTFGLLGVLVPVVAGFVVGGLMRPALVRALGDDDSPLRRALAGVATGVVAGVLTGVATGLTAGSLGPGRLAEAGPDGLLVGLLAALEVGLPAAVALAVGSDLVRLPERPWGREHWVEAEGNAAADAAADDARAGSLVAALDEAGAGRASATHRFTVHEAHESATHADPSSVTGSRPGDVQPTETIADDEHAAAPATAATTEGGPARSSVQDRRAVPDRGAEPEPERLGGGDRAHEHEHEHEHVAPSAVSGRAVVEEPDDVPLPDWARTDAVAAERVTPSPATPPARSGISGLRDRLRGAAGDVRARAGELRDRVGGAAGHHQAHHQTERSGRDETLPHAPGSEQQPAFPWSTEEFVAGRDDVDQTAGDEETPGTGKPTAAGQDPPRWDQTDQIAEDELPWWRRPKHDA
ncbi:DUF6350 family protein [Curtobacterium sp. ODYSSEY 48 V2]|uniref:cell division protein PerM n=1 Tax=Curtobacterium sp. ODYSSEY 48 V2 TaxID=2939561 RepID=UPI00203D5B16|nr:DUF6350 family protein [Curtobacterium sp. ODYSSEY 48 V2]MCM3505660.1 DUF6350 family protein [Curtobacterium sp. ODYSSEY 48 V2]